MRIHARMRLVHDGKRTDTAARHGGMRYLDLGETAVFEVGDSNQRDPDCALLNGEHHPPFTPGHLTSVRAQPQQ